MLSFRTFYKVDDDEVPTVLRLEEFYGDEEYDEYGSWVLLEPTAGGGEAKGDTPEAPEAAGSV